MQKRMAFLLPNLHEFNKEYSFGLKVNEDINLFSYIHLMELSKWQH